MKLIELGICIDNVDPKGMGRIRCVRYSEYTGPKEMAMKYEPWGRNDLFIAGPFLPVNINFIPEIGQSVKIINYNRDTNVVNKEYIAGPFSTMHDFNSQTFSQQVENTTYGNVNKESPDIIDKDDNYIEKKSAGVFAKKTDYGVYGKFGSDIIFTENGLQLRGGKLVPKESTKPKDRKKSLKYPIMGKKMSALHLKKYPKKMRLEVEKKTLVDVEVGNIKTIIEYGLNNDSGLSVLTNPTRIEIFVYQVVNHYGNTTKTNVFDESSPLPMASLKLINSDNSDSQPTFTIPIDSDNIKNTHSEINNVFYTMIEKDLRGVLRGLESIGSNYSGLSLPKEEQTFPVYFRPTERLLNLTPTTPEERSFKRTLFSKIRVHNIGPKSGLIWSKHRLTPPTKERTIIQNILKIDKSSTEQTFSSLKSDKIFLLSTDANEAGKSINFNDLDKYEYTQEDYIENIDPNTFSSVRGEHLLRLLLRIIDVLFNHEHNLIGPMVKTTEFKDYVELMKLLESVENDILNKSIRIN